MFDIPGVIYPREMLIAKAGFNRKSGRPYKDVPGWGISSREAAKLLGNTPSAARAWLHRHKVPYRIVGENGQMLRLLWRKKNVELLAHRRLPILRDIVAPLISSAEARKILCVVPSTLHRYQQKGRLNVLKVRIPTMRGLRKCSYFNRAEVERLAKYLSRMRKKESEIRSLRRSSRPLSHIRPRPKTSS